MFDFYREIECTPIDIVYVGETVCSKRRSFRHQDWIDVAERLQSAGKEVVFTTLVLLEANSELGLHVKNFLDGLEPESLRYHRSIDRILHGSLAVADGVEKIRSRL